MKELKKLYIPNSQTTNIELNSYMIILSHPPKSYYSAQKGFEIKLQNPSIESKQDERACIKGSEYNLY